LIPSPLHHLRVLFAGSHGENYERSRLLVLESSEQRHQTPSTDPLRRRTHLLWLRYQLLELEQLRRRKRATRNDGDRGEINPKDVKHERFCAAHNRSIFGPLFLIFIGLLEAYRLQAPHAMQYKDRNAVSLQRALRALCTTWRAPDQLYGLSLDRARLRSIPAPNLTITDS
jgi:hypothetical protein